MYLFLFVQDILAYWVKGWSTCSCLYPGFKCKKKHKKIMKKSWKNHEKIMKKSWKNYQKYSVLITLALVELNRVKKLWVFTIIFLENSKNSLSFNKSSEKFDAFLNLLVFSKIFQYFFNFLEHSRKFPKIKKTHKHTRKSPRKFNT